MDMQFHFPDRTLTTEHQALVEALNRFLAVLPDDEDREVVVRLVMELLELADMVSKRRAGWNFIPANWRAYSVTWP